MHVPFQFPTDRGFVSTEPFGNRGVGHTLVLEQKEPVALLLGKLSVSFLVHTTLSLSLKVALLN